MEWVGKTTTARIMITLIRAAGWLSRHAGEDVE
jgi:hypothetical protein